MIRMCANHPNRPEIKDGFCQECLDKIAKTLGRGKRGPDRPSSDPKPAPAPATPPVPSKGRRIPRSKDPFVIILDFVNNQVLLQRLKEAAAHNYRSPSGEIMHTLDQAISEGE